MSLYGYPREPESSDDENPDVAASPWAPPNAASASSAASSSVTSSSVTSPSTGVPGPRTAAESAAPWPTTDPGPQWSTPSSELSSPYGPGGTGRHRPADEPPPAPVPFSWLRPAPFDVPTGSTPPPVPVSGVPVSAVPASGVPLPALGQPVVAPVAFSGPPVSAPPAGFAPSPALGQPLVPVAPGQAAWTDQRVPLAPAAVPQGGGSVIVGPQAPSNAAGPKAARSQAAGSQAAPGIDEVALAALIEEDDGPLPWDHRPLLIVIASTVILVVLGVAAGLVSAEVYGPGDGPGASWRNGRPTPTAPTAPATSATDPDGSESGSAELPE